MTEQIMGMLQDGLLILLQIAVLAGLLLLRKVKQCLQSFYETNTTHSERQLLAQIGREAFAFAETVYRGHDGPAKMNEAIRYLLDRSQENGLGNVPMMDARAVIESAWLEDRRQIENRLPTTSKVSEEQR